MKKNFYVLLLLSVSALFSCSNESEPSKQESFYNSMTSKLTEPCPEGTYPVLEYEFETIRLHRASRGCNSGFSICSDGKWVINCRANPNVPASYNISTAKGKAVGNLSADQTQITLHFPIEIYTAPGFVASDFVTFGFDVDYELLPGITIAAGDYTPTYTTKEIVVICRLK